MISFPDINVLLALAWSHHPHHQAAHAWFGNRGEPGWTTTLWTQSGFLRLSMNPQIVHVQVRCADAVELLDQLTSHPDHHFSETAPSLGHDALADLAPRITGHRQMSDATLLHLARRLKLSLVTFDQAMASLSPWVEHVRVLSV